MLSTRARRLRLAVAATLLPTALTVATDSPAHAAGAFAAHYAAPYLELSSSTVGDLTADLNATGNKFYTLAFVIPQSGCTGMWEAGNYPIGSFSSEINNLKNAGGDVIISFGGAAGGELAQTCTDVASLQAAYANIVNTYGVTRLDFDIEGTVIGDTTSNAIRDQALAALQAANPAVQVDYTLAVDPNGLTSPQLAVLDDAKAKGVKVNAVNIMAMDFGAGTNDLNAAESASHGTVGQLQSIYGISAAAAWGMLGITPIAGTNDDGTVFSQSDAAALESFAASNGAQELSFWEVDSYDKATGYAYTRAFAGITGGTSTGGGVVSFRSHANGKYVTADNAGSSPLIANKTAIGTWEQFDKVTNADGTISLRAHANNMFVTTPSAGGSALIASAATIAGAWEAFDLISNADGSVSLRARSNNQYVTAENAGASALIANRSAIGGWEEFDLLAS